MSDIQEKAESGLAAKAAKSGISISTLRKVYNRGMAAWKSGHRPGTTPQQWAMARVNSYITKGKGTYYGADKDLREDDVNYNPREYDYEGEMAKTQLRTIMRHAQHMHDMLQDNTNLPEWVQSKITLATDYMQTAHDYMMSEMNEEKRFDIVPKDKETGLPKKYTTGTATTDKARAAHFKKNVDKSDSDPGAYEPAPGDATAETKPSKHTLKYKAMFGEVFDLKRLGSNPGKFKRLVAKHLGAKAADKIDGSDGTRIMAKAKRTGNTTLYRQGSFIKNFYGEAYEEGSKEIRVAYARMTPGQTPFVLGQDKNVPQDNTIELRRRRAKKIFNAYFDEANENKPLGKPFRTPGEKKKFAVYVRNASGNVVKVRFGDPNLSIKRHRPARRKSFRARHNCQTPGPRWKARYWSCRQWRAGARVEA